MREIKFRAKVNEKGLDKFWEYGGIIHITEQYKDEEDFEECDIWELINTDGVSFNVDKYTIGQYTGLKDKNGKEIYEGDIILTQPFSNKPFSQKRKEKRLRGIVNYNIKCGKNFVGEPDKLKYWGAEWNVEIIDKEDYKKYCYWSWGAFFECEVIGNIYDNPELLEV